MSGRLAHIVWHRLIGLMPGELNAAELSWLISPHGHLALLSRRRADMIVNRVRLFALLFALLTPLWSIIDCLVFPFPLWFALAAMRVVAAAAFAALVVYYKPGGTLADAYRALAILFAIPTTFYLVSHVTLAAFDLRGISAAIGAGYAFLPFVLLAGFAIFPLTLAENLAFASPVLLAQALSGLLRWYTLDWPTFAGSFWLLTLLAGVSTLAGMSQLAFMIALVRQAVRDPLTGIFSRCSGEEMLELHFPAAVRAQAPLSVAFIDLDHFKRINDGFGHEAGDAALKNATEAITRNLRRGDILARWGGEEFVVLLPGTAMDQAVLVVQRIREQGLGVRPDGQPLTASIGLSERIHDQAADWRAMVEIADRRMYAAKSSGRDKIIATDHP
jgi:diguanylate cyclase (GGDEF)-like protein